MVMTLFMQFFEDCQTDRENIVKEVLYKKARVLACVEEGKKPIDESLSKYLRTAIGLLKEVFHTFSFVPFPPWQPCVTFASSLHSTTYPSF